MYYLPTYYPCQFCMTRQFGNESSYIRVLHAAPLTGGIDVYENGNNIAGNLRYRGFTPYIKLPPKRYNINAYTAGTSTNPLSSRTVDISPGGIYTLAAIGTPPNVELYPISDVRPQMQSGMANIRFVNLSPDTPPVDVVLPDGRVLFSNTGYRGITNYIPAAPGRYTLEAKVTGTNRIILTVPNIVLRQDKNYTFYLVGLSRGEPGLQLLIPLDGSTYLW
jgi:hypothetical protein